MRRIQFAVVVAFVFCPSAATAAQGGQGPGLPAHSNKKVCSASPAQPDLAACSARIVTQADGMTPTTTIPASRDCELGDSGYGVEFPAASSHVVAVGGTSLSRASNARGWMESAWSGAGSGCSVFYAKPAWQTVATACSNRAEADVSALADPNTGVAIYDSYGSTGGANWYVFGGTSVSSPIVASVFGLAGNAGTITYPARLTYTHISALNDVTTGRNGTCGTRTRLCTAMAGWDGPTGLGTPNGIGAF